MTQSTTPTTPGEPSNVTSLMPWLAPQPQWGRPGPVPPSCFSQLYALNQCYDDILAMKAILAKVVCDLATNDKEFQQCLANGIASAGSGAPLVGVTNGSDAAPGIVGEWYQYTQAIAVTGAQTQTVLVPVTVQPGDWDTQASVYTGVYVNDLQINLNPLTPPTGVSGAYLSSIGVAPGTFEAVELFSATTRVSISVPTLLPFQVLYNGFGPGTAGNTVFQFTARRAR